MWLLALGLLACHPGKHRCDPGELCVVAGVAGAAGFNGDGLPADETYLYLPTDVFVGTDGRLVIVDYNNYRLRELEDDGTLVTVYGNGVHGYSAPGTKAIDSPFENPIDAMVGPDGLVYIVGEHEGRILQVDEDGVVQVIAGTGDISTTGDGGPATDCTFEDPTGMAFDDDGNLYVADSKAGRVRRVDAATGTIDTVLDGLKTPARVNWDADGGRMLIAEAGTGDVLAYDPATGDDEVVASGFEQPQSAIPGPDGSVLVAGGLGATVDRVDADGTVTHVVGDGIPGSTDELPVPPDQTRVTYPAGLLLTDGGDLYVADMLQHEILVWKGAFSP